VTLYPTSERDAKFVGWLMRAGLSQFVEPFLRMQKEDPQVLQGLDVREWEDIFMSCSRAGSVDALASLLGSISFH